MQPPLSSFLSLFLGSDSSKMISIQLFLVVLVSLGLSLFLLVTTMRSLAWCCCKVVEHWVYFLGFAALGVLSFCAVWFYPQQTEQLVTTASTKVLQFLSEQSQFFSNSSSTTSKDAL